MRRLVGAAVAACMLAVSPAQAGCWNTEDASAATVRELQSMLMVATLRCQVAGHEMVADYNGYLQANKATIQRLNDRLKAHFIKASGAVAGQRAYDAFATTLANVYGAEASSPEVCGAMISLTHEAAMMAGSEDGLLLLAQREGIQARLPEGRCALAESNVAMMSPAAAPAADGTTTASATLVSQMDSAGH